MDSETCHSKCHAEIMTKVGVKYKDLSKRPGKTLFNYRCCVTSFFIYNGIKFKFLFTINGKNNNPYVIFSSLLYCFMV